MSVKIVIDSTADILPGEFEGVEVLPLTVFFGEESYLDGVEITYDEFYEKLRTNPNFPKSSQVNVSTFIDTFKRITDEGDDVFCMLISSNMSGTYNSACVAKKELQKDNIFIVDSRTVTFEYGALVLEAIRLRNEGKSAEEIAIELENLKTKTVLYAMVEDLNYLKRGGRISSASAVLGNIVNIKPIITIREGLVNAFTKAIGVAGAFAKIGKLYAADEVDTSRPILFANSGDRPKAEKLKAFFEKKYNASGDIRDIGPTVGTHIGQGCVGIVYFKK